MSKCPFCDQRNPIGATQCQGCGAPLETKIDTTVKSAEPAAPPPEPGSLDAEILNLLQAGKKIDAIKLHRRKSGLGLKESKDYVEALAAKYNIVTPGGCAGVVLLAIVVGAAFAAWKFLVA